MSTEDTTPLGRWSQRKADARREAEKVDEAAALDALDAPCTPEEPAELVESEDAEQAEIVAKLPDIDSLDKDSDYSIFMGKGVPEHLKRLALRKLWLSDPVLANVDGLVDYGEDFTVAELMGDAVKTAYRVGRGLIDEAKELAEKEEPGESGDEAGEEAEIDVEVAELTPGQDDEAVDEDDEAPDQDENQG